MNPLPGPFIKFPKLPIEIKDIIWRYALPNPRTIRGAIMLSINLDLASPRAILPSIFEYQEGIPSPDTYVELTDTRSPILSVMHTCRVSRRAALRNYRLDVDSIIEDENCPWWNLDDIVYILPALELVGDKGHLYLAHSTSERWQSNTRPSFPTASCTKS
jgi:hypothetical protein